MYQSNLWGCHLRFEFPFVKLTDWLPRLPELEAERNPFALVVAAHLRGQQTRGNASERLVQRLRLVRGLLERGLSREDIERLFDLIDWFMALPPPEETVFWDEMDRYEKENNMPHMTSIERRGLERGRAEGRAEGQVKMLLRALEARFQTAIPEELAARIRDTTDLNLVEQWFDWTLEAASLDDFQRRMQAP